MTVLAQPVVLPAVEDPLAHLPPPAGDPSALRRMAAALTHAEQRLDRNGRRQRQAGTVGDGWRGPAAARCAAALAMLATRCETGSQLAQMASAALETCAAAWDQARNDYARARRLADAAVNDERAQLLRHAGDPILMLTDPYVSPDRLVAARAGSAAVELINQAATSAAVTLSELRDSMPMPMPTHRAAHHWWDSAWHDVTHAASVGADDVASVAPVLGDAAGVVGGAAVAALGTGMEIGGVGLDATVVLAPAGAALNVGGAAVIAGGVATSGLFFAKGLDDARKVHAEAGSGSPAQGTWRSPDSLDDHFARHGNDFGIESKDAYASTASDFLRRAVRENLPAKIDSDGTLRIYDPETNTFAAYNRDGTTRTFFKPQSPSYWARQPGSPPPVR